MSKQTINIGASPNDGTGTPLRTSFDYTNQNFTELYTALGGGVGLPGATTQVIFNDGGTNLAGDAGLVYNKTTDALTVAGLVTAGSATITGDLTVDTSTLKVDSTNNRVGIGTASPTQALSVNGAIDFKAYVAHMDNFAVYAHSSDGTILSSFTGYPICFRVANVEQYRIAASGVNTWSDGAGGTRMTLDSTGLGIGVAPVTGAKLAVAGPIVRNKGTDAIVQNIATTVATLPGEGLYIAYAFANASNPNAFTSYAVILCDSVGSRVIANNGTQITITTSTYALQVTQIFAATMNINWSFVQIG